MSTTIAKSAPALLRRAARTPAVADAASQMPSMASPNPTTVGRMALRQRLAWLLVTMYEGRYPAHSGAGELAVAYCAATGMPSNTHAGRMRSRQLTKDLGELHERGLAERQTITLREDGRMAVVLKFELTAKGRNEASNIAARAEAENAAQARRRSSQPQTNGKSPGEGAF